MCISNHNFRFLDIHNFKPPSQYWNIYFPRNPFIFSWFAPFRTNFTLVLNVANHFRFFDIHQAIIPASIHRFPSSSSTSHRNKFATNFVYFIIFEFADIMHHLKPPCELWSIAATVVTPSNPSDTLSSNLLLESPSTDSVRINIQAFPGLYGHIPKFWFLYAQRFDWYLSGGYPMNKKKN